MGNIRQALQEVLSLTRKRQGLEKQLKECLLPREYRHIMKIRIHKNGLIIYLDSSVALYELNLKKERILNKLKEQNTFYNHVIFKVGS